MNSCERGWTWQACLLTAGAALAAATVAAADSCQGDINGDGVVDGADLALVIAQWGTPGPDADLDGTGQVDGRDIGYLLARWGPCPEAVEGPLFSMRLEGVPSSATTTVGSSPTLVDLDLSFVVDLASPPEATRLLTTDASLFATSVPADNPTNADPDDDATGGIFMDFSTVTPEGSWNRVTGVISIPVFVQTRYWLLNQINPASATVCTEDDGSDGFVPSETWEGVISGLAVPGVDPETGVETIDFIEISLSMVPKDPNYHVFETVPPGGGGVFLGAPPAPAKAKKKEFPGIDECAAAKKCNKQVIRIQPVFIKYGTNAKTGTSFDAMKAKVEATWGKCCVDFVWLDPTVLEKPQYKDLKPADDQKLRDEVDKKSENKDIEVFFVNAMITNTMPPKSHRAGDGNSLTPGDKVIVADEAVSSCDPKADSVLAHELGHACGGLKHNDNGVAGTVMVPTGKAADACPGVNTSVVKAFQCTRFRGDSKASEKTPKAPCCLTHD